MATSTDPKITLQSDALQNDQVSRSHDDVEMEIKERLHFTQHAALRHITFNIEGTTVVLYGRVPSYYLKQLAQVKVTCVPGIDRVDNRIEVAVS